MIPLDEEVPSFTLLLINKKARNAESSTCAHARHDYLGPGTFGLIESCRNLTSSSGTYREMRASVDAGRRNLD